MKNIKKWIWKIIPTSVIVIVAVVVFIIGFWYFKDVSEKIHTDSTNLLNETYRQVSHSVQIYIRQKWLNLKDFSDYVGEDDFDFEERQTEWGFENFYFLNCKEPTADAATIEYLTYDGEKGNLTLENNAEKLFIEKKEVMARDTNNLGSQLLFFAVPIEDGVYQENGSSEPFSYKAIAISYDNANISRALNTNPFGGEAKFIVIHKNGDLLFTTDGNSSIDNYINDLNTSLDPETMSQVHNDWEAGKKELTHIHCDLQEYKAVDGKLKLQKQTYCILYESIAFDESQDYILLSLVPQILIRGGFLSIQRTTIYVLIAIFLLIGVTICSLLILRAYLMAKNNKTELKYREQMFDVLSSNVDDVFIMIDPETKKVDYLSPNIERLLGIPGSVIKNDIREMAKCAVNYNIIVPQNELEQIPEGANKSWECEYMHQSTGERRWYRVTIYHMNIRKVKKYIVVMSDKTIDRQMNQKLEEALNAAKSANEAKSNFLSNMSHDIRTPMNAIVGFSVLLEKDADNVEKVREYTHKIMASSHHLLSLINDVLDMSKIESGKTSLNVDKFSLPELLEELDIIIRPQAKAKKQEFTLTLKGKPAEQIMGDKLRLNQILINLLSNAVKYTQVGGRIEFIVTELEQPSPQYAKLRFTVRDNGIGMSEEFKEKVFAPFSREINSVTNKIQGTGLGMAITKNLVDLMGGIITVESAPGQGSTFTVEMSFLLPEPEEREEWYHHKVTRMLVADDEEDICLNIKEMMHDTGVDVSIATSGAAAVEKTVHAHEAGNDFHVILLDWKMPEMDGVETARRIRQRVGNDIPILVLTSYDWSDIEDEARKAGINAFMPKPFFASTFWQTIKPLFENTTQSEQLKDAGESVMNGKRFLIAEDNELNAEIFTEMLSIEGAEFELARDGQEAVEMFEASELGHYDMIFMDVQMPIMNGYEATKKIRNSSHPQAMSIPIVAMTANTFAEDVRNALDAGMDGHLAKPINMEIVRETVSKLFNKKEMSSDENTNKGDNK